MLQYTLQHQFFQLIFYFATSVFSTNATSAKEDIAKSQQELNHVTIMLIIFFALTSIFTFLRGSLFTLAGEFNFSLKIYQ